MAGLGYKVFAAGEVLTAANVNGYLMEQSVMVFDDSAARGSAIGTPTEGMVVYLKDTDAMEFYSGSAWTPVGLDPYTVTASTATSYTIQSSDYNKLLQFTAASAVAVTVGTATAFDTGQKVDILQDGAGTVTISAESTAVTLYGGGSAGTAYTMGNQYQAASIVCVGSATYRIIGNITAV